MSANQVTKPFNCIYGNLPSDYGIWRMGLITPWCWSMLSIPLKQVKEQAPKHMGWTMGFLLITLPLVRNLIISKSYYYTYFSTWIYFKYLTLWWALLHDTNLPRYGISSTMCKILWWFIIISSAYRRRLWTHLCLFVCLFVYHSGCPLETGEWIFIKLSGGSGVEHKWPRAFWGCYTLIHDIFEFRWEILVSE